ncbi:hypothetical protein EV127DRAFT_488548 [Xylaria flabelliformis]|nr:hypothetical protein EV127DRAFT_488548 [Xylaria flabelliformis]
MPKHVPYRPKLATAVTYLQIRASLIAHDFRPGPTCLPARPRVPNSHRTSPGVRSGQAKPSQPVIASILKFWGPWIFFLPPCDAPTLALSRLTRKAALRTREISLSQQHSQQYDSLILFTLHNRTHNNSARSYLTESFNSQRIFSQPDGEETDGQLVTTKSYIHTTTYLHTTIILFAANGLKHLPWSDNLFVPATKTEQTAFHPEIAVS